MSADAAARIRIYATTAHRAADAARAVGTDPTGDHGVELDVNLTSSILSVTLAPASDIHSFESDNTLPWRIDGTATVTLTYIQTEA